MLRGIACGNPLGYEAKYDFARCWPCLKRLRAPCGAALYPHRCLVVAVPFRPWRRLRQLPRSRRHPRASSSRSSREMAPSFAVSSSRRCRGSTSSSSLPRASSGKILWADVAKIGDTATASAAAQAPVQESAVRFDGDSRHSALQRLAANGDWTNVCLTPCQGTVPARGLYRVGGSGIRSSEPFRLPKGQHVHIRADTATRGSAVLGGIMAVGGSTIAFIGLNVLIIGLAADSTYENDGTPFTDSERSSLSTVGGVMLGVGAVAGIVGLVMIVNNRTEVRVEPSSSARRSPHHGLSGPRIALTSGLSLTARGLEF
jgi:hypothetical protein